MDPAAVEAAITPRTKAILIVDIFGYPAEVPDAGRDRRAPRPRAGRGRLPVDRRRLRRPQARHVRPPGGLRLLRQQAAHHRRGRGRADRRRRAGAGAVEPAQPGPLRRRRLARPLPPGLQLPPLGRPLRDRRRPARAPRRHDGRPRAGGRAGTRSGCARSTASRPCTRAPSGARGSSTPPASTPTSTRDEIIGDLEAAGVSAKPYLPCIHLQPYYREAHGHGPGEFPVTEAISASTIALPFFPEMTEAQVDRVCAALGAAIAARPGGRAGAGRGDDRRRAPLGRALRAPGRPRPSTASTRRWRSTGACGRTTSPPRAPTPACSAAQGIIPARGRRRDRRRGSTASRTSCGDGRLRLPRGRRGHPHRRRAAADRARRATPAAASTPPAAATTRSSPTSLLYLRERATAQRGLLRGARRGPARARPRPTLTPCCRATPTASAPSRCASRTTCWPTSGCSAATAPAWAT